MRVHKRIEYKQKKLNVEVNKLRKKGISHSLLLAITSEKRAELVYEKIFLQLKILNDVPNNK